jgi:hypothetical protein
MPRNGILLGLVLALGITALVLTEGRRLFPRLATARR